MGAPVSALFRVAPSSPAGRFIQECPTVSDITEGSTGTVFMTPSAVTLVVTLQVLWAAIVSSRAAPASRYTGLVHTGPPVDDGDWASLAGPPSSTLVSSSPRKVLFIGSAPDTPAALPHRSTTLYNSQNDGNRDGERERVGLLWSLCRVKRAWRVVVVGCHESLYRTPRSPNSVPS